MNTNRSTSRASLSALLSALLCAAAAHGQTAQTAPAAPAAASNNQEEAVQLPEFTVSSTAADPYHQTEVTSVSRIAGSILDAPFSVNVVSRELMNDLGANSGYDVNRYFAGLSAGRGAGVGGIMDRQDFRGFESFSKTIDDFSSFELPGSSGFQANFDTVFIEHQELVMGPDSILSPTGTPGGSVNIITKSPQFTEGTDVSATVGNYGAGKYTLDSTGPLPVLGNRLAYRVIYSFQDANSYMPGSIRQQSVGLMATYKFSEESKLTFKYMGEDWGQFGEIADANDWGELVYTPDTVNSIISKTAEPGFGYRSWNGDATWSRRIDRINIAELEFTTPIFKLVNMRVGAQALTDHFDQDAAYPAISPSETFNASTGYLTSVALPSTASITSMPVIGQYSNSFWRGFQLQNDYAANFHPGPVSVQEVAGWTYQQGHQIYGYSAQDNTAADLPNVNLLANNGAQLVGAGQHPPLADYTHSPSNAPAMGIQRQAYELTKVGLYDDRVILTGGVSRTWEDVNNYKTTHFVANGAKLPAFVGPYTLTPLDSHKDTFLGGVVMKPTDNSSVYYTFSSNSAIVSNNSLPLWQTGKQHEFGFKTEFFNQRLSINADHFQIAQLNLVTPNPLFNIDTSQPPSILGAATSKGYELNVTGGITKNLSVIGSVTAMKYRDQYGRRARNVPDHLANLLLNYHISEGTLKGASAFVGVVHMGNVAGENGAGITSLGVPEQPSFFVAGWTVINAGAHYAWDRYGINLNVDNVANSHFPWDPAGRNSVPFYPGLTFKATVTIHI